MKRLLGFISIALLVPSLGFAGTLTSLDMEQVTSAFSDKTITTISAATLNGKLIENSFSGYFSKDGKMIGKFNKKPEGSPQNDKGSWRVDSNGMFCYKWDSWDNNKENCIGVYKLSNGLLVINSNNGFESFILDKDIKSGNNMR